MITLEKDFSFTGLSVVEKYIHHIPYSIIYSLYVEKNAGDYLEGIINRINKEYTVITNPTYKDLVILLNNAKVPKIIAIKENNYLGFSQEGIANYEKAFCDLFYETSRKKIPFMKSEVYNIGEALAVHDEFNYSTLLSYSYIRKIVPDIKKFILWLSESVNIPPIIIERCNK